MQGGRLAQAAAGLLEVPPAPPAEGHGDGALRRRRGGDASGATHARGCAAAGRAAGCDRGSSGGPARAASEVGALPPTHPTTKRATVLHSPPARPDAAFPARNDDCVRGWTRTSGAVRARGPCRGWCDGGPAAGDLSRKAAQWQPASGGVDGATHGPRRARESHAPFRPPAPRSAAAPVGGAVNTGQGAAGLIGCRAARHGGDDCARAMEGAGSTFAGSTGA
jgi:hypothetical protein